MPDDDLLTDRLVEIFSEASAIEPGPRRARFIADACGDDISLREEVVRLLEASHRAGGFMSRQPDGAQSTGLTEQAGDRIGPYTLLKKLGEGGCGIVYKATREAPLRRTVALKIIKPGMDTRDVIARFEAERQALALMDHPNIAHVYEAGTTPCGRPYFAMELVDGVPITIYCDKNFTELRECLALFGDVCSAINHAHQKGVIHRDIKPSNVMVSLQDGQPVVKVIDFGIAKATQGKLTEQTLFTRYEQLIGTPAYMSPEQANPNALDIDTRSDIYALGILLYELLTGRTPFDPKTLAAAGYEEMRRIIREVEPPRPSTQVKQEHTGTPDENRHTGRHRGNRKSTIAADLDWIVMKAIEKDRTRRYETANGLAVDIQRFLADEPVSASPPSTIYRFRKFARRNKGALRVTAAIAAALIGGTVASIWQAVRATGAEKVAQERVIQVAAERDAKEQARQEATAVTAFMKDVLRSPNPDRNGRTITIAEVLDRTAKELERNFADRPSLRSSLQASLADTYGGLGLAVEAAALQEKVRDHCASVHGPSHPVTLGAMHNLATFYEDAGDWRQALALAQEVVDGRLVALGLDSPETLSSMGLLATCKDAGGQRDEAIRMLEEVLERQRRVIGPRHKDTLVTAGNLASLFSVSGRLDDALKLRQELLPLSQEVNGPKHPHTIAAMHSLASSLIDAGQLDEALKQSEEALVLSREVNGHDHPLTLKVMLGVVSACTDLGLHDRAIELSRDVVKLREHVSGSSHPDTIRAKSGLAIALSIGQRHDEAATLLEDILPQLRTTLAESHPVTVHAMIQLAIASHHVQRPARAQELLQEAVNVRTQLYGSDHPDTVAAQQLLDRYSSENGDIEHFENEAPASPAAPPSRDQMP